MNNSNAIALIHSGRAVSYATLHARGREVMASYGDAQVVVGETNRLDMVSLVHGAWAAKRALFALDPTLPRPLREALLAPVATTTAATDVRLIVATTGSTGTPKAVMLSEANISAAVAASNVRIPLHPGDIWLNPLPLSHIGGLSILYRAAAAGATVLLAERFEADHVWAEINAHPVSHISVVPAMLAQLLDAAGDRPPPPALRVVLTGGAALSPALAGRALAAGWPLAPTYGMSETGSQLATLMTIDDTWRPGQVGRPLDSFEVALVGDGRLAVRGPAVMCGYLNADLRPGDGLDENGWFKTGDVARVEADGTLSILGRADDVLISGGVTLHPTAIEAALSNCPGVEGVAVTATQDPTWGDVVVALYVGTIAPAQVLAWARENLAGSYRPRQAVQVDELPLNRLGKSDRRALKKLIEGHKPAP
ncbi:hypothetical protein BEN30_02205 [Magnetovibrio blakemorei]|uniref:2-succinylbenzoate--CoA ligase n=2 Tax=Magnetovibrio blakemorei TaxID=28181 RepID=A0A1E5QC52_9PROT|nr:hypothetical protein BEN30_02205 [Magnetovibrio blakemorei]